MPFYEYNQNNSGGSFVFDEKAGISVHVIIEADDADSADRKAKTIGLYFDGVADGRDCDCCGDRWYAPYDPEGRPTPSHYGATITSETKYSDVSKWSGWMTRKGRPEGFIHYADGRIVPTLT